MGGWEEGGAWTPSPKRAGRPRAGGTSISLLTPQRVLPDRQPEPLHLLQPPPAARHPRLLRRHPLAVQARLVERPLAPHRRELRVHDVLRPLRRAADVPVRPP